MDRQAVLLINPTSLVLPWLLNCIGRDGADRRSMLRRRTRVSEPPNELEYRDPVLDKPERSRVISQFIGGIVFGAATIAAFGFAGFAISVPYVSTPGTVVRPRHPMWILAF